MDQHVIIKHLHFLHFSLWRKILANTTNYPYAKAKAEIQVKVQLGQYSGCLQR